MKSANVTTRNTSDRFRQRSGRASARFTSEYSEPSIFWFQRTKYLLIGTPGIALSGIQSAQTRIAVSAHNFANFLTEDFRPQRVEQTASSAGGSQARVRQSRDPQPVRLEREIVDQIMAKTAYSASARVFEVSSEIHGTLLDMFA